jgi:hypothetical protein
LQLENLAQIVAQSINLHNGNTGYGVFKGGIQKLERFLAKNQLTQRKLLNFENWSSGERSKIGCKQGAENRVIVIQKEKRTFFQGHNPTHVFKTRIVGAD